MATRPDSTQPLKNSRKSTWGSWAIVGEANDSKGMEVDVLTLSSARLGSIAQSSGSGGSLENQQLSSDKRTRAQQESHARADALAPVQRQEKETSHSNFFTSTNMVNTALGAGIVLWVIQGVQILAAILWTAPALIQLDPLSVLPNLTDQEEPEADSAGKLFDKK